jgi:hypothetical protein
MTYPRGITEQDVNAFKALSARCWIIAGLLLSLEHLDRLDVLAEIAEAEGPRDYPDIWRANAKAIMEDREMFRALATCARDLRITSPSVVAVGPEVAAGAEAARARIEHAIRDACGQLPDVPPLIILRAFVNMLARMRPR